MSRRVPSTDFVPVGETVNGMNYAEFLKTKLRLAVRKKQSALINATPHESNPSETLIDRNYWENLLS